MLELFDGISTIEPVHQLNSVQTAHVQIGLVGNKSNANIPLIKNALELCNDDVVVSATNKTSAS